MKFVAAQCTNATSPCPARPGDYSGEIHSLHLTATLRVHAASDSETLNWRHELSHDVSLWTSSYASSVDIAQP